MAIDDTRAETERARLRSLERPRYFYGKLMTVRDKQAEYDYHAGRQNLHNRLVTGEGAVSGLDVRVTPAEEGVTVRVDPGLAVDALGRLVIIPDGIERTMMPDWGESDEPDRIHLYLRYDWCEREKVPQTGAENATGAECDYGRILETFELEAREGPPNPAYAERKLIPDVDFPTADDLPDRSSSGGPTPEETEVLNRMARSYYERKDLDVYEDPDNDSIFLGTYESTATDDEETAWTEVSGDRPRPLVYRNDLLYAVQARHVTDPNAHGTGEMKRQISLLREYVMNKSIRSTLRVFSDVAVRFENETAGLVAKTANDAVDEGRYRSEQGYLDFIDEVLDHQETVADDLEGTVTEENLTRYRDAVEDLADAVGREGPIRWPDLPEVNVDLGELDADRIGSDLPSLGDRFPAIRVRPQLLSIDLGRFLPWFLPRREALDLAVLQDEVSETAALLEKREAPRVVLPGGHRIPFGRIALNEDLYTPFLDTDGVIAIPDLIGVPLPEARRRLEEEDIPFRVEVRDVSGIRELSGTGVIDVLEVSPAPGTDVSDVTEVVLAVPSLPSTSRVDGIGDAFENRLEAAGIGNLVDLAEASVDEIVTAAEIEEGEAERWHGEANRLLRAYELTRVEGIGLEDAETLATGADVESLDDLRTIDPGDIEGRLNDAAETGTIARSDADRLRSLDWAAIRDRIDSLGPR